MNEDDDYILGASVVLAVVGTVWLINNVCLFRFRNRYVIKGRGSGWVLILTNWILAAYAIMAVVPLLFSREELGCNIVPYGIGVITNLITMLYGWRCWVLLFSLQIAQKLNENLIQIKQRARSRSQSRRDINDFSDSPTMQAQTAPSSGGPPPLILPSSILSPSIQSPTLPSPSSIPLSSSMSPLLGDSPLVLPSHQQQSSYSVSTVPMSSHGQHSSMSTTVNNSAIHTHIAAQPSMSAVIEISKQSSSNNSDGHKERDSTVSGSIFNAAGGPPPATSGPRMTSTMRSSSTGNLHANNASSSATATVTASHPASSKAAAQPAAKEEPAPRRKASTVIPVPEFMSESLIEGSGSWYVRNRHLMRVWSWSGLALLTLIAFVVATPLIWWWNDDACQDHANQYMIRWNAGILSFLLLFMMGVTARVLPHNADAYGIKTEFQILVWLSSALLIAWIVVHILKATSIALTVLELVSCALLYSVSLCFPLWVAHREKSADFKGKGVTNINSLDDLVAFPLGFQSFMSYLKREFSQENLLFWTEVKAFKRKYAVPDHRAFSRRSEAMQEAELIFGKYIYDEAPLQVNLADDTRMELLESWSNEKQLDEDARIEALQQRSQQQQNATELEQLHIQQQQIQQQLQQQHRISISGRSVDDDIIPMPDINKSSRIKQSKATRQNKAASKAKQKRTFFGFGSSSSKPASPASSAGQGGWFGRNRAVPPNSGGASGTGNGAGAATSSRDSTAAAGVVDLEMAGLAGGARRHSFSRSRSRAVSQSRAVGEPRTTLSVAHLFEEAAEEVYMLMSGDSLPRYINSAEFARFALAMQSMKTQKVELPPNPEALIANSAVSREDLPVASTPSTISHSDGKRRKTAPARGGDESRDSTVGTPLKRLSERHPSTSVSANVAGTGLLPPEPLSASSSSCQPIHGLERVAEDNDDEPILSPAHQQFATSSGSISSARSGTPSGSMSQAIVPNAVLNKSSYVSNASTSTVSSPPSPSISSVSTSAVTLDMQNFTLMTNSCSSPPTPSIGADHDE